VVLKVLTLQQKKMDIWLHPWLQYIIYKLYIV
jgi:hypothetical protein